MLNKREYYFLLVDMCDKLTTKNKKDERAS